MVGIEVSGISGADFCDVSRTGANTGPFVQAVNADNSAHRKMSTLKSINFKATNLEIISLKTTVSTSV